MKTNDKSRVAYQLGILAAHKCNEITKLSDAIDYGINSFEVDIHVAIENNTPVLMIGHELETSTGQTFEEYIDDLMILKPDFTFLWLDFKDLNGTENQTVIRETLINLDTKYNIKNRVLVESRYIQYLTLFVNEGWTVSFYSDWSSLVGKTPEEQKAICDAWLQSMQENDVDGISFDAAEVNTEFSNYFPGKTVNGRPINLYGWNYHIAYTDPDLEEELQEYTDLSVLLISFSVKSIKNLIADIEFAEDGTATNMGEAINSLPVQEGVVNKIQTQYNSTYEKYEAVFDGTNFFYVPYTSDDVIGNAIKDKFTMELLFTPVGGKNPFASLENGGLGYELTETGELEFWYNADNQYVLPNDSFKTQVQLGQNIYYHVFVAYDGTTFKLYLDGTKVKEQAVSGEFTFPEQQNAPQLLFGIGGDYMDSATPAIQNPFIGRIVQARIYDGALNDLEIKEIVDKAIPQLITDVEFGENGVATNMGDSIDSLPVQEGVNAIQTQYNNSYQKYEAVFDGTNYFYIPYSKSSVIANTIKSEFSIELLFTPVGGKNPFASLESGGLGFELSNAGKLQFWYSSDSSYVLPTDNFEVDIELGGNTYYHVFVTYDGNIFKLYADGIKVAEESVPGGYFTFPRQNNAPEILFGIGADYKDSETPSIQNPFTGRIVYAKIYSGALSEAAVKRLTENTVR